MSEKTRHTAGPWKVRWNDKGHYDVVSEHQLSSQLAPSIAKVLVSGPSNVTAEANARRIVAAVNAVEGIPVEALEDDVVSELLEAVEALDHELQARYGYPAPKEALGPANDAWRCLRSVIAKAKGAEDA